MNRRLQRLYPRHRAGRRTAISFTNSSDYWPLTIVPSTSKPKRSMAAWLAVGIAALLGALGLAVQRGIAAW